MAIVDAPVKLDLVQPNETEGLFSLCLNPSGDGTGAAIATCATGLAADDIPLIVESSTDRPIDPFVSRTRGQSGRDMVYALLSRSVVRTWLEFPAKQLGEQITRPQ
jgi:hypothetical protein